MNLGGQNSNSILFMLHYTHTTHTHHLVCDASGKQLGILLCSRSGRKFHYVSQSFSFALRESEYVSHSGSYHVSAVDRGKT